MTENTNKIPELRIGFSSLGVYCHWALRSFKKNSELEIHYREEHNSEPREKLFYALDEFTKLITKSKSFNPEQKDYILQILTEQKKVLISNSQTKAAEIIYLLKGIGIDEISRTHYIHTYQGKDYPQIKVHLKMKPEVMSILHREEKE